MTRTKERGSVTAFTAVLGLALLICAGLVVDGGAKIQAYREAYAVAEEAARAGAGQVDIDHAYAAWADSRSTLPRRWPPPGPTCPPAGTRATPPYPATALSR